MNMKLYLAAREELLKKIKQNTHERLTLDGKKVDDYDAVMDIIELTFNFAFQQGASVALIETSKETLELAKDIQNETILD